MQALRAYSHSAIPIFFFEPAETQPQVGDQPPVEKALGFPPVGGFMVEYSGDDLSLFGVSVEEEKAQEVLFAINVLLPEEPETVVATSVKRTPEPMYIVGHGVSRSPEESNIFGAAVEMDANWESTGIISLYVAKLREDDAPLGLGVEIHE
jgi:hypothetical protein